MRSCALALGLLCAAHAQEAVVRIGTAAPTNGWLARLGIHSINGARLAVETLNRQGMQIGGRRVTFELVAADDAGDAGRAVAAARTLVDARVSAVVGHLLSGQTIAAAPIYAQAGIPQVSPSATRADYTRQGLETAFRVIADDARIGRLLARHAVGELKAARFVLVDDRSAYGRGLADEFARAVAAGGGQIVDRLSVAEDAADFRELLARVQAERPDAILFGGLDRQAGALLKQMHHLGLDTRFVGGDGLCTPDLVSYWAAGQAHDDQVLCAAPAGAHAVGDEAMRRFADDYRQRFGVAPEFYAPYAYDAVMVLAGAMARAGSSDPALFLGALAQTRDHRGLTGAISFDAQGDVPASAVTLFTYRDEEQQPIRTVR
jgi:branched-chain amino acid transport system substrate-binding protein